VKGVVLPSRVKIPEQLQNPLFRFNKLIPRSKKPAEKDYYRKNNYPYDSLELLKHIREGGNYGVITGPGNLIVLDLDETSVSQKGMRELPKTFTVKSGRENAEGRHMYYILDDMPAEKIVLNDPNEIVTDAKGRKRYKDLGHICAFKKTFVVGSGSIYDQKLYQYTPVVDVPIAYIKFTEIMKVFKTEIETTHLTLGDDNKPIPRPEKKKKNPNTASFWDEIKSKLYMTDVEPMARPGKNMKCRFHMGKTDSSMSFSADGRLFKCWSCGLEGSPIDYVMAERGLSDIQAAHYLNDTFDLGVVIETNKPTPPKNVPPEMKELSEPHILKILMKGIKAPRKNLRRLVGENRNAILTLLGCVSSKTQVPANIAFLGQTSQGKTEIVMSVLQIIPPLWTHLKDRPLTGVFSPKSLRYIGEPPKPKKVEKGEEPEPVTQIIINLDQKIITIMDDSGEQAEFIESIKPLLSRDSDQIAITIAPTGGSRVATTFVIRGYPVVIALTTKTKREAEKMGRFINLSPNPPKPMDILKDKSRNRQCSYNPDNAHRIKSMEYLDSLQKVTGVLQPFDISESWETMVHEQSNRHFETFLNLISQITVLFQHFRQRAPKGEIVATWGDYQLAAKLISPLIGSMRLNAPPNVIKFCKRVKEEYGENPFFAAEVQRWAAGELKIGKSTFHNTYWGAMRETGIIEAYVSNDQEEKGGDGRVKKRGQKLFYVFSENYGAVQSDFELKLDMVWGDRFVAERKNTLTWIWRR